ncbi:hypothetical protein JCM17961_39320 [Endothiovibrio diazotrophicus]
MGDEGIEGVGADQHAARAEQSAVGEAAHYLERMGVHTGNAGGAELAGEPVDDGPVGAQLFAGLQASAHRLGGTSLHRAQGGGIDRAVHRRPPPGSYTPSLTNGRITSYAAAAWHRLWLRRSAS